MPKVTHTANKHQYTYDVRARHGRPQPNAYAWRFAGGEVQMQTNPVVAMMYGAERVDAHLEGVTATAMELAQAAVAPGVGPGPHPHRTDHGWEWLDTGDLMEAILYERVGMLHYALVVDAVNAPYWPFLELGYHGPSGRFYQYPFLVPAARRALRETRSFQTFGKGKGWHPIWRTDVIWPG